MKYVSCNLCGSEQSRELYPATLPETHQIKAGSAFNCTSPDYGQHYRIVQCEQCGLVFANPRGVGEAVLQAYEAVEDPLYLQEQAGRVATFRKHLKPLHRLTGEPAGRRLLDVGAYTGIFVEVATEAGWAAEGIEPSTWAARHAQQNGLAVKQGTLANGGWPDESFDVITMWDVIEHFDDPLCEVAHAFRLLKPGGTIVIHTIDIGSLTAKVMGGRWPFLMEMHVVFFSRATLRAMLEKAGFVYLRDHTQGRYLRLGYLAGRVRAAFGPWIGGLAEWLAAKLNLSSWPMLVNTLDLFTAYARKQI
ncbi:MAG: class I SAM-dependent methyltransferase [Chloroflexi bacterium]|nr:class I SAM-dependent methyltransferase [Chloroflexota bacterium]